jgi:ferredoxin
MANIIFYFTGTGNSLVVARDIAEKIGDAKIVSIADAIKENNIDLKYERVGFVFPVYFYHMPVIVERFIKKLEFSKSQYIFGVATYAGMSGDALTQLSQCIVKQSGVLGARFAVRVPGNYIVEYGAFPTIIQTLLFRREKKKTGVISKAVNEKKATHISKGDFVSGVLAGYAGKAIASFGKNAQNFNVNEKCTGCASCEMICPVGNIKIENSQPIS